MASAGTRAAAAALLFSFFLLLLLLLLLIHAQAPAPRLAADLLAAALDRFLDGRGLLELATRRNMILLCHAILLLILRDAGVLGAPAATRRSRTPPGEATPAAAPAPPQQPHATRAAAVAAAQAACSAVPVPARPRVARSADVWRRRPRNRAAAAPAHDDGLVERQTPRGPAKEAAAAAAAVSIKEIVLVESPRNADDDDLPRHHDRAVVVERLEHPTAIAADGERDGCYDRRIIIAVADDDDTAREQQNSGMEMELADDRAFEEFIESQRRQMQQESLQQMRQESLQLVSSGYPYQAIAACY